ncbi:hypothetical protein K9N68_06025 [Kovacikia minuta CCNUW1]|uniref:hypothetical protein n=1 Tax=Kovacikia minuta TaxID=2931930 RepID=UPI001CCD22C3|nr:hypothetical protein [Kovacikia minuta]UBF27498.1 hypothetical protein K9N68_06025 [Kovacikia minuta CCNUW1]
MARQQRRKPLPISRPMPALVRKPETVVTISTTLSATEREALQVAETVAAVMVPSLPPTAPELEQSTDLQQIFDSLPELQIEENQSKPDRSTLVEALLDEAWQQGLKTYPQLIGYIKEQTGEGCSRRADRPLEDLSPTG